MCSFSSVLCPICSNVLSDLSPELLAMIKIGYRWCWLDFWAWFWLLLLLSCYVQLFCDPMDCSLPGSFVPGKNIRVPWHFLLQGLNMHLLLGTWILHCWAVWEAPWYWLPALKSGWSDLSLIKAPCAGLHMLTLGSQIPLLPLPLWSRFSRVRLCATP